MTYLRSVFSCSSFILMLSLIQGCQNDAMFEKHQECSQICDDFLGGSCIGAQAEPWTSCLFSCEETDHETYNRFTACIDRENLCSSTACLTTFIAQTEERIYNNADPLEYESTDVLCSDGIDNDDDGYTDCEDWDCSHSPHVTVCD